MVWSIFYKSAKRGTDSDPTGSRPPDPPPCLRHFNSKLPALKSASRHPKIAQDRPKTDPGPPQTGPRAAQERPRAAQERPRSPQDRPKTRLKAILKPCYFFKPSWIRKSSETFIFKWFGAFFINPPWLPRNPGATGSLPPDPPPCLRRFNSKLPALKSASRHHVIFQKILDPKKVRNLYFLNGLEVF